MGTDVLVMELSVECTEQSTVEFRVRLNGKISNNPTRDASLAAPAPSHGVRVWFA